MKKTIYMFMSMIVAVSLASCGSSDNTKEEKKTEINLDKEEHNHDGHEGHSHEADAPTKLSVPEGAKVFFGNLNEGDIINSPVDVAFGIEGMEVEAAGALNQGKGHHHIIINGTFIEDGKVVPKDETNIHFGKGQTETQLELEPGEYTLTMQFADGFHQSYGEQMSTTIKVTVE
jgi:hypothetical protein